MKKFLAVVTVALLAVSLFAGGSAEKADDSQVTLKIANYAVLEQGYIPFWEGVKSGFEAKYPNYKIEWVTAPLWRDREPGHKHGRWRRQS